MKRIGPFFGYYGAKYKSAGRYPKPEKPLIIEPFGGAAGYSVFHYWHNVEIYDINPRVFGVWDYLNKVSSSEFLKLPVAFDTLADLPSTVPQEAKWLIGFWLRSGGSEPRDKPSHWARVSDVNNAKGGFWGDKVKFRIAGELRYIRHWKISNKSYQEIENKDACWYIDPPYHRSGSLYTFKDIDYSHLARWSMERMGRVMVCEQKGADWLPFRSFIKITGVQSRKNPTVSEEVIWTNW
jgi:hypothetical protein